MSLAIPFAVGRTIAALFVYSYSRNQDIAYQFLANDDRTSERPVKRQFISKFYGQKKGLGKKLSLPGLEPGASVCKTDKLTSTPQGRIG